MAMSTRLIKDSARTQRRIEGKRLARQGAEESAPDPGDADRAMADSAD
jgi:hypothetical protein